MIDINILNTIMNVYCILSFTYFDNKDCNDGDEQ